MSPELLVEQDGSVLRLTLNRPEHGNGVTGQMARAFTTALSRAHETSEVVVVRGAGQDFCVGRSRGPDEAQPAAEAYRRRDQFEVVFDCYWAIRRAAVPVVSIVHGRAMGFGAAVAGLSDVCIASEDATFNIPEMGHNIMPTMVVSALFDRMNRNAILWMAYSQDFVSAERALQYGLVSTVVPSSRLETEAARFCEQLVRLPRPGVRGLKEYLRVAPTMDTQGAVDYARSIHAMVNTATEMRHGGTGAR